MAFNEPRILNQSTIKENKQGHLEDSEDGFQKSLSATSYQIHLNPPFLKASTRTLSPNLLLRLCALDIHINTLIDKMMYFAHRGSICSCLEMALFGISLNSRGIVCQGLIRC